MVLVLNQVSQRQHFQPTHNLATANEICQRQLLFQLAKSVICVQDCFFSLLSSKARQFRGSHSSI